MKLMNSFILSGCLLTGCLSAQMYGNNPQQVSGNQQSSFQPSRVEVYEIEEEGEEDGSEGQGQGGWGNRGWGNSSNQSGQGGWGRNQGQWGDRGWNQNNTTQICQAIQSQSRIQAVIRTKEVVNSKELKMTTKLVTVEPYAFGTTRDGLPVLKGNIVDQKDLREVTVKVYEDMFNDKEDKDQKAMDDQKGWFRSTGVGLVDLRRARNLQIVPNTRFDAPKDFKGFDEKDLQVQVVCSLPVESKDKDNRNYNQNDSRYNTQQQQGYNQGYNQGYYNR